VCADGGDFDGDGAQDLVVGARYNTTYGDRGGQAVIYTSPY